MYMRPAIRSAAWASVSVADPLAGLVGLLPIGMTTPAFLPASAGAWKWAAVASPVSPEKVTVQFRVFVAVSKVTSAVPVPLLSLAGTSCCAFRLTLNVTVSANAPEPNRLASANATNPLQTLFICIVSPPLRGQRLSSRLRQHRSCRLIRAYLRSDHDIS